MSAETNFILKTWVVSNKEALESIIFRNRSIPTSELLKNNAKKLWMGFQLLYIESAKDIFNLASFFREFDIYGNYLAEILLTEKDFCSEISVLKMDLIELNNIVNSEINILKSRFNSSTLSSDVSMYDTFRNIETNNESKVSALSSDVSMYDTIEKYSPSIRILTICKLNIGTNEYSKYSLERTRKEYSYE